ncbi:MAG: AlpA family transcriptional regulator [Caulobacterales bacterium]|nr:AlpA family transcriptional regulator [Caulobacterales bacterium]MCA0372183.1 AlpA family transcriptional regulator [Pseudomonadota bacterium]
METFKFIRLRDVIRLTSLSRATIYEKMKKHDFPTQVKLGGKSVAWVEVEIQEWINSKIALARA